MRFADHPTAETDVFIAAPPATVWPLVSDIAVPARFSRELQEADWEDPAAGGGLGARFVGRNLHPRRGEWRTVSTVVEFEPERRFGWAVEDPANPAAVWHFELAAEGEGTRLRQWAEMGPGPSGVTVLIEQMPEREEAIIERRLGEWTANMTATVAGIRDLAEGSAG